MKRLLLAACIASLAACGGGKDDVKSGYEQIIREQGQSLVYAFPGHQQIEVPTPAPVALRFTSAIKDPQSAAASITITDAQGQSVAFSFEAVDGDQGLLLTPDDGLAPLTQYTVKVPALALVDGNAKARTLTFTTRGLHEGPASQVSAANFEVKRLFPDGTNLPVADMSSLRLQLSQPIDRSTVKYGNAADSTINLTDANGALVPASVLVGDGYLTIDPTDDMTPGETYTLTISPDLKSRSGNSLAANSGMGSNLWRWSFQPIDTRPTPGADRARMVQLIDDKMMNSPLTGKQINQVPMYSVLLGLEGTQHAATPQAHGYLAAELAHLPSHPDVTPLTIKRGSLIETDSMTVHIGGEVPAGFNSGTVRMEFLSDATGYLIDNPFSSEPSSPKQLRLMMDMGISADVDKANGAVTQTIQHIELVGTAIVEDGMLTINAMGVVEPNVLGTERASALLSFYMQGLDDQNNAPTPPVDDRPLELVSWTMEDLSADGGPNKAHLAKPGDPIILNFNKPLDSISDNAQIELLLNGAPQTGLEVSVDGASLKIQSKQGLLLERGTEITSAVYELNISGLSDVHGNSQLQPFSQTFSLPIEISPDSVISQLLSPNAQQKKQRERNAPMILAMYPGYPCLLNDEYNLARGLPVAGDRNLSQDIAGRCAGGHPGVGPSDKPYDNALVPDDLIPVMELPANRGINIFFSTPVDPDSVVLGKTFSVERVDSQGAYVGSVSGIIKINQQHLTFTPEAPWDNGALYSINLSSSGYSITPDQRTILMAANSNYSCGVDAICDTHGLPLQTQPIGTTNVLDATSGAASPYSNYIVMIRGTDSQAGGPSLKQFFRGGEPARGPLQLLTTAIAADTNHNFALDRTTTGLSAYYENWSDLGLPGPTMQTPGDLVMVGPEEVGPSLSPSESQDPYDPDGLVVPPNAAKVLSRLADRMPEFYQEIGIAPDFDDSAGGSSPFNLIRGLNTGCGYMTEVNTSTFMPLMKGGMTCPSHKFSFLSAALFAEVTDEVVNGKIKVKIYPSMVLGTSLNMIIHQNLSYHAPYAGSSGRQMMRMRYAGSNRSEPVIGWIEANNNEPVLSVDMDLYLDVPYSMEFSIGHTNILDARSIKLPMSLSGPISFLDDGRMYVEQYNTNLVDIFLRAFNPNGTWTGFGDLYIPEGGNRLDFISQPIK